MWDWITGLRGIDAVFFGCAALGGSLFLLRVALLFLGFAGGDADVDADVGMDVGDAADLGDADLGGGGDFGGDLGHPDVDLSVGLLSFTGLTSFFMMFGLTGLSMRLEQDAGPGLSIFVAALVGLFTVFLVSQVFKLVGRLRSSGNVDPRNAIGQDGQVYLNIPAGGRGQVQVTVQGRLRVMDAVARPAVELRTGTSVRVTDVIEGNVLVVQRA